MQNNDLISRKALMDAVDKSQHNNPHSDPTHRAMHKHEHNHFLTMILQAPAVDAVILPCKIGSEVWLVEKEPCNGYGCPYQGDFGNWRCNVNGEEKCNPFVYSKPFTYDMIGTKFYLTREEAEAALAKMKGGEGND